MMDVSKLLFELCEDERVFDPDFDLFAEKTLDSLAMIQLFDALEDEGIALYPTQVAREDLRTPGKIQALLDGFCRKQEQSR